MNYQKIYGDLEQELEKLPEETQALIRAKMRRQDGGNTVVFNDCPVSLYNYKIDFNPFQYKPYFKLFSKENTAKCIYIADEVGVGKTYETGILITELLYRKKISLSDGILILCPNMMCEKWQDTLANFFGLGSKILREPEGPIYGIAIVPFTTGAIKRVVENVEKLGLFVLDEAHNSNGAFKDSVIGISKISEYRIILSATPISRGEETGKDTGTEEEKVKAAKDMTDATRKENEQTQKQILFGAHENEAAVDFFGRDSLYFNRTLKAELRPEKACWCWNVRNIQVNNPLLKEFVEKIVPEVFFGKHTLNKYIYLNMLSSSSAAEIRKRCAESLEALIGNIDKWAMEDLEDAEEDWDDHEDYEDSADGEEKKVLDAEKAKKLLADFAMKLRQAPEEDEKLTALNDLIENRKILVEQMTEIKVEESDNASEKIKEAYQTVSEEVKAAYQAVSGKELDSDLYEKLWREQKFYKKLIIFTKFKATVEYLAGEYKEESVWIDGTLSGTEKSIAFKQFRDSEDKNILILTNVGCEGLDMDFCNALVNFDLDYNPVLLEQRKGRIDRFEVKKSQLYIYNYAIEGVDPDEETIKAYISSCSKPGADSDEGEAKPGRNSRNSMYWVILRKLRQINEITGIYYNVLDTVGSSKLVPDRLAARRMVLEQFRSISEMEELAEFEDIEYHVENMDKKQYMNRLLESKGIENIGYSKDALYFKVDKKADLLNFLFAGGTPGSHLIYTQNEY